MTDKQKLWQTSLVNALIGDEDTGDDGYLLVTDHYIPKTAGEGECKTVALTISLYGENDKVVKEFSISRRQILTLSREFARAADECFNGRLVFASDEESEGWEIQ